MDAKPTRGSAGRRDGVAAVVVVVVVVFAIVLELNLGGKLDRSVGAK